MTSRISRRLYSIKGMDDDYLDRGHTAELENKWVFEIAWEVVNKG